jgi:hypothetical protein
LDPLPLLSCYRVGNISICCLLLAVYIYLATPSPLGKQHERKTPKFLNSRSPTLWRVPIDPWICRSCPSYSQWSRHRTRRHLGLTPRKSRCRLPATFPIFPGAIIHLPIRRPIPIPPTIRLHEASPLPSRRWTCRARPTHRCLHRTTPPPRRLIPRRHPCTPPPHRDMAAATGSSTLRTHRPKMIFSFIRRRRRSVAMSVR